MRSLIRCKIFLLAKILKTFYVRFKLAHMHSDLGLFPTILFDGSVKRVLDVFVYLYPGASPL